MKKISADASISGNASPITVPFTAYLAAKGFLEDLLAELGDEVIEVRGRLVLAKGAPRPAAWAQNTWETPVFLPIESIGDGARKLTAIQRVEVSKERIGNQDVMTMVMQSDIEKIRMTLDETDQVSFNQAVAAIANAKRIYVLGVRSASVLANFISFYFRFMFDNLVSVDTSSISEVFEQIVHISADDVFIGLSFPRYSKRTIKAMQYAKDQGAKVVAITDSKVSPLTKIADVSLLAKSDMASFVDSLVAPLSLVNALIVAISREKAVHLESSLNRLESIWEEYDVYEKQGQD